MILFLSSFLLGSGVLYYFLYHTFLDQETATLFEKIAIIETSDLNNNEELGTILKDEQERLTIITSDGTVLFDNFKSDIEENHLQREEIKSALKEGNGTSIRYSTTMDHDYIYAAIYDSKDDLIVRLATPFSGVSQSAKILLPSFGIAFLFALFLAWILTRQLTTSIMKPLKDISQVIRHANIGKESIQFPDYQYPELTQITEAFLTLNEQTKENMEALDREKQVRQEFFTNASHELKTPLTSIRGYSELLRAHAISDANQVDHCLDCVLKESDHMTKLINDILTISKLETMDYKVVMNRFMVKESLTSVIDSLQVQASQRGITIHIKAIDFMVYANPDQIQELFYNLVSNAIKYNKQDGCIYITLRPILNSMTFIIEDTGIGISKEDQERVFQRFYRVDKQRSKTIAGTGLGLAIVKHIVQFYNGQIQLESQEYEGTRIEVRLPILVEK